MPQETREVSSAIHLGREFGNGGKERRVRQLLYDGGFDITRVVRSIGAATGPARDALAAGALLANLPGAWLYLRER